MSALIFLGIPKETMFIVFHVKFYIKKLGYALFFGYFHEIVRAYTFELIYKWLLLHVTSFIFN